MPEDVFSDPQVLGTLAGFIEQRNDGVAGREVEAVKRSTRLMVYSRTSKAQPYVVLTVRLPAELFFDIDWGHLTTVEKPQIGRKLELGVDGTRITILQFCCQNQAFLDLTGQQFQTYRLMRIRLPSQEWDTGEHGLVVLDGQGLVSATAVLRLNRERMTVWTADDYPIRIVNGYEPFDPDAPRFQNVDFLKTGSESGDDY